MFSLNQKINITANATKALSASAGLKYNPTTQKLQANPTKHTTPNFIFNPRKSAKSRLSF
jgi:hypothetical protein